LGGQMTLTSYVGLYQEKPGMTSQLALTQNYQGRPVYFLCGLLEVSDRLDIHLR
jgi:hypothetical protein